MQIQDGTVTTEDGVRLFFQKLGSGPQTVVLLNGVFLLEDFRYLSEGRTLISLDLRNRGRSEYLTDKSKLKRGILQDVDDLETLRGHLGLNRMDMLAHSYAGIIPILYAIKYPGRVDRIVQIGPVQPNHRTQYPKHLTNTDTTLAEFFGKIGELERERQAMNPAEFCRRLWAHLRLIYVADPADAVKIKHWEHCELQTESNLMTYWVENIAPSLQNLNLAAEEFAKVHAAVLTVHGTKDRSAPYGGGKEWAMLLPNARLLTVENAAHAPWIESPGVLQPIQAFLDGTWPDEAQRVIFL